MSKHRDGWREVKEQEKHTEEVSLEKLEGLTVDVTKTSTTRISIPSWHKESVYRIKKGKPASFCTFGRRLTFQPFLFSPT